jgi:hypothetical protein
VQAKLEVGGADDPLEREADDRAEAAVSSPALHPGTPSCPACGSAQGCACSSGGSNVIRRSPLGAADSAVSLPEHMLETGAGRPLDAHLRGFMTERLGHDFGAVRVHDSPAANAAAAHIGARAFTRGSDVFFAEGRYQPDTQDGRRLIAHELTHTVQQGGSAAPAIQREPEAPAAAVDLTVADQVAREVFAALDGWNNEQRVINALSDRSEGMRAAIQAAFHRHHGWSMRGYLWDQLSSTWAIQAYALLRSHHTHDPHTAMAMALIPLGTRDDEIFRLLYGTNLEGRRRLEEQYNLTFGEAGNGTYKLGNGSLKADLKDDLSGWREEKSLALLDRDLTEADELYFDSVGITGTHEEAVISRLQRVWDSGPQAMLQLEADWNRHVRNNPPWTEDTWTTLGLYDAMSSELSLESWRLVRAILVGHIGFRDRVGVAIGPLTEEQARTTEALQLQVAEDTLQAASQGAGTNDAQIHRAVRQIREIYVARIERAVQAHDAGLEREARAAWEARRTRLIDVEVADEMDRETPEYQRSRLLVAGSLGPADEVYLASLEFNNDAAVAAVTRVWAQGRIGAYLDAASRARVDERGDTIRPVFNPLFVVPVTSGLPSRRVVILSREDYDDAGRGSGRLQLELEEGTGESELAAAYAFLTTSGMRAGLRDEVLTRFDEVHLGGVSGETPTARFLAYIEQRYGRVHSLFQFQDLLAPARTAAAIADRAQARYDAAHSGVLNRVLNDMTRDYDTITGEQTELVAQESLARLRYIAQHVNSTNGELTAMMSIFQVRDANALAQVEYGLFQQRLDELRAVRRAITEAVATAVQLAIETVATILTAGAAGPMLLASLGATLAAIATREALLGDEYQTLSRENAQQIGLVFAGHGFSALGRGLVPITQEMSRARIFLASAAQEGISQVGTQMVQSAFEGHVPTTEGILLSAASIIGHSAGSGTRAAITHTPGVAAPAGVRADVVHNLGGPSVSDARRLRTAIVGHLAQNAISTAATEGASAVSGGDLDGGEVGRRLAVAMGGVMARGVMGGIGEFGAHSVATSRQRRADAEEAVHDPSRLPADGAVSPRALTLEPGIVVVARVNHEHSISLVRDAQGRITIWICSPNCGQLIGLLDEVRTRANPADHAAIQALRDQVHAIQRAQRQYEPTDPAAAAQLAALAPQVEALRARVGETQMFQGIPDMPIVPNPRAWVYGPPGDSAISSLALPPGVGIRGPRDFNGNARDVTNRVLGDPIDLGAAFARIPRIPFDPAAPAPTGRSYSQRPNEGTARAQVYLTTLPVNGTAEVVAVKLFPSFGAYERSEALHGTILGELGVGPRVHGVVDMPDPGGSGRIRTGIVMEPVAGDFPEIMPAGSRAVTDLQTAVRRMRDAGLAIGDFQYFITPEGRAVIIDAGGAINDSDPRRSDWSLDNQQVVDDLRTNYNRP